MNTVGQDERGSGLVMRFEERAHKFEYRLTDTDDQIVEYIEKNKAEVISHSIQSLAAKFFTVPNTVMRLSKKLGYDGFSQLKNGLKDELRTEQKEPQDNLHFNINKTISLIDEDKMSIVAKMIQKAGRVLVCGIGDTTPFCELLAKNLSISRREVIFHVHRHETMLEIEGLTSGDLLFVISLSGETDLVLDMAQLGKGKGVPIISLTHFSRNRLQQMADVNLYCYAPRKMINQYNVTDKTPLMIVLRLLSEYIWKTTGVCV